MAVPHPAQGRVVHPRDLVRWPRYWFTPALNSSAHFSHSLALAQGAFAFIRSLTPPGAGLAPYLCQRLATSLLAAILLCGADLFTFRSRPLAHLDTFWHNVQRSTANWFSATPVGILSLESCLPPVSLMVCQRQRLAALRMVCSAPRVNLATARLHHSFPALSIYRPKDSVRPLTLVLRSLYLPLNCKTPRPVPTMRNHLPIDAVTDRTFPFTQGLSRIPMIKSHLASMALTTPSQTGMDNGYSPRKKRVREALLDEWARLFPKPGYYHHLSTVHQRPLMGMCNFLAGRIHQMSEGKSYLAAHPTWRTPDANNSCPPCSLEPVTFEHTILSYRSRPHARSRLLHGVSDICHQDPIWTSLPLLKSLASFISLTSTGFLPTMFPPTTPPSSTLPPISPH